MKSVMEEASSIAQAVEQAWERAGKPREFTVKIFEEAKRGFFGFTKQPAKIALIFDERTLTAQPIFRQTSDFAKVTTNKQNDSKQEPKQKFKKKLHQKPARRPSTAKTLAEKTKEKPAGTQKSLWSNEMVDSARTWVEHNLKIIGVPNITFTTSVQKYYLRLKFDTCVLENKEKEKKLFSAFAYLIMATLRNKFKKELRGLKVVLIS